MCRQKQLYGCALMAFGIGVLLGTWLEGSFWLCVLGIGTILVGICVLRKNR